jgi:hypothetical protein
MQSSSRILYCHCAYSNQVPKPVKEEVLARLNGSGMDFEAVADLCELSARRDPLLKQLADKEDLRIVACFPRAVRGLFSAASAPLPEQGVEIMNMRSEPVEEVVRSLFKDTPGETEIS